MPVAMLNETETCEASANSATMISAKATRPRLRRRVVDGDGVLSGSARLRLRSDAACRPTGLAVARTRVAREMFAALAIAIDACEDCATRRCQHEAASHDP